MCRAHPQAALRPRFKCATRSPSKPTRTHKSGRVTPGPPPSAITQSLPRLTVPMVARLQGFPDDWKFSGKKTNAYRQVGNAFPPPVAKAVATSISVAPSKTRPAIVNDQAVRASNAARSVQIIGMRPPLKTL